MKYAPIADEFSDDLKNLLSSILQFDPNNRPRINDLVKRQIIWDKVGDILSQDIFKEEFSHTTLTGNIFKINKEV